MLIPVFLLHWYLGISPEMALAAGDEVIVETPAEAPHDKSGEEEVWPRPTIEPEFGLFEHYYQYFIFIFVVIWVLKLLKAIFRLFFGAQATSRGADDGKPRKEHEE